MSLLEFSNRMTLQEQKITPVETFEIIVLWYCSTNIIELIETLKNNEPTLCSVYFEFLYTYYVRILYTQSVCLLEWFPRDRQKNRVSCFSISALNTPSFASSCFLYAYNNNNNNNNNNNRLDFSPILIIKWAQIYYMFVLNTLCMT